MLASVTVDSVVTPSPGTSYKISTISSGTLNFTDRDSARISFYYTGQNNSAITPMEIYYTLDTTKIYIFNSTTLNPAVTEQYINVTVPSPRVNSSFRYQILTTNTSGISFFKFRELKIYKK
ncbi:MAG TPA: hypothetical protein PKD83_05730 [Ignavibacteria bacterium]|nr:hypothetical protein [Ignavibacteria bacterium]